MFNKPLILTSQLRWTSLAEGKFLHGLLNWINNLNFYFSLERTWTQIKLKNHYKTFSKWSWKWSSRSHHFSMISILVFLITFFQWSNVNFLNPKVDVAHLWVWLRRLMVWRCHGFCIGGRQTSTGNGLTTVSNGLTLLRHILNPYLSLFIHKVNARSVCLCNRNKKNFEMEPKRCPKILYE